MRTQPEQEHLAALHRQAFMGAPVAQRLPVALGLVHLQGAPVLQVEAGQRRRRKDLLATVEEARPQHRVALTHALRRRGQALRVDIPRAEFQEGMAADVAQHLAGATSQPVGLLHGRQLERLIAILRRRQRDRCRGGQPVRAGQQVEPGPQAGRCANWAKSSVEPRARRRSCRYIRRIESRPQPSRSSSSARARTSASGSPSRSASCSVSQSRRAVRESWADPWGS